MRASTATVRRGSGDTGIWISQPGGHSNCYSDPEGRFVMVTSGNRDVKKHLQGSPYSAAKAFVEGDLDVHGDIFAAIRHVSSQTHKGGLAQLVLSVLPKIQKLRIRFAHGTKHATKTIQFHYDRSNEFYAQFLDSRMIYSSAYFEDVEDSLEIAQTKKLDRICRDLVLRQGERFLDVGCGWGGLVCYAAETFGTSAFGCTLSRQQFEFASKAIKQRKIRRAGYCRFMRLPQS